MWVSIYSINQSQVQRYISCKTLGHAKMWEHLRPLPLSFALSGTKPLKRSFCLSCFRSLYVNMVGLWVTVSLAVFSGLTMFSIYKNCDPLSNGDVNSSDQVNAIGCLSTAAVSRATGPRSSKVSMCTSCCPTSSWIYWRSTLESLACLWLLPTAAPWGEGHIKGRYIIFKECFSLFSQWTEADTNWPVS